MRLTIEELGALNVVLDNTNLADLLNAAARGYSQLAKTDCTSNSDELAIICNAAVASLQ